MTDIIFLTDPDDIPHALPFGLSVPNNRWTANLVVCWVHQHRLLGLVSEASLRAAQNNKPFYLHEVCAWISQIAIVPTGKGTQVQSVRAIVRYDNAGATIRGLRVTQCHAVMRVVDQPEELIEWMVTSYKAQARPSGIQLVSKLPPGSQS